LKKWISKGCTDVPTRTVAIHARTQKILDAANPDYYFRPGLFNYFFSDSGFAVCVHAVLNEEEFVSRFIRDCDDADFSRGVGSTPLSDRL
jgi:hypothetical protein